MKKFFALMALVVFCFALSIISFADDRCTIWAAVDLNIYNDGEVTGILKAGNRAVGTYEDGQFILENGSVDADLCLVNLPDYMGDIVSYDVTNSYGSVMTVHGNEVSGITGEELPGYEGVYEGNYVPLLQPVAEKLKNAAEAAAKEGYKLKIYEAYRPYEATRYLFDTMTEQLYNKTDGGDTIYNVMTGNGAYLTSAFLAKSASSHNYGVALDITLEKNGKELEMQTNMHDLSAYSVLDKNNGNADLLAKYMEEAGFDTLFSEWWHFQDNASKEAVKNAGINIKGLQLEY